MKKLRPLGYVLYIFFFYSKSFLKHAIDIKKSKFYSLHFYIRNKLLWMLLSLPVRSHPKADNFQNNEFHKKKTNINHSN